MSTISILSLILTSNFTQLSSDWFKQLCLSWIIVSAAAICVSCQELSSTLREGNRACLGEEVVFTCAVNDSSSLPDLFIAWSSDEYIGPGAFLQFTTNNIRGANDTSMINGNVTASLTRNANESGVRVLESVLRIVAAQASVVTCNVINRAPVSTEFFISAVPGAPQNVEAVEVSDRERNEDTCIIVVQWDPPANTNPSDINQYTVNVTTRNILADTGTRSNTIHVARVPECDDDVRVQVAAVSSLGCVGPSVEVPPSLLGNIPTSPPENVTTSPTVVQGAISSRLNAGAAAGITIAVIVPISCILGVLSCVLVYIYAKRKARRAGDKALLPVMAENERLHNQEQKKLDPKECILNLYIALRSQAKKKSVNARLAETDNGVITSATGDLRAVLKEREVPDIKFREAMLNSLEKLKQEKLKNKEDEDMQGALDYLMGIIPDMSSIDNEFKSSVEELRNKANSPSVENALDSIIQKVYDSSPDKIKEILLRICDALFENLLKLSPEQEAVVRQFKIPLESLKKIEKSLSEEFDKGLESDRDDIPVKMFITHVHEMPKGTEEDGEFLVVDLGVSYLQVLLINIRKGRIPKPDSHQFFIPEKTKKSSSHENLFNFIVNSIAWFIKDRKITRKLLMGFTFPFPMKHRSINSGELVRWTREFNAAGADEDKDVFRLLKAAFDRRQDINIEIDMVALVNDTTATQLALGNEVSDCSIGLILGDGANACYMERLNAVPKFKGDRTHYSHVIINTEWGAFGDDGKLEEWREKYDKELDKKSSNPGQQLFEKMISDKYQGIIVCLALKDLIIKGQLFGGESSPSLDECEAFTTQRLSEFEGWDIGNCKKSFRNNFKIKASDQDCEVVRRVCEAVSTRAARLAIIGIVALAKKINKMDGCTVAVDGSLYEKEKRPLFRERIEVALDELEPDNSIKMKYTEHGSSRGAAFAAAMSKRQHIDQPFRLSSRLPSPEVSVQLGEHQEDMRRAAAALSNSVPEEDEKHNHQRGGIELSKINDANSNSA